MQRFSNPSPNACAALGTNVILLRERARALPAVCGFALISLDFFTDVLVTLKSSNRGLYTEIFAAFEKSLRAGVAELADALASGASPGNRVEVRVLSSAPSNPYRIAPRTHL